MSDSREAAPQQAPPQQVAPQMVFTSDTKCASKALRKWIIMIVLSLLTFLANLGVCAYYSFMAFTHFSNSYYDRYGSNRRRDIDPYPWRAGLCGVLAFFSLCVHFFALVKYRQTKRKLMDPNQYVTEGVTYVYQGNNAPVFYPPPGAQWQQQQPQQGYFEISYPQPAYGPLPPGRQPMQYPQPMQQQPVNPSQV